MTGSLARPEGLRTLGTRAFSGNSGLTGLTLPTTLTTIGASAFAGCYSLAGGLVLPAGLTSLGMMAFSGCTGLSGTLSIPAGITTIPTAAFSKTGLTGLTLPEGLTTIESQAFQETPLQGALSLPGTVTAVGDRTFYHCYGLTEVSSSGSLTVGKEAFSGCEKLVKLRLTGVTALGESAFEDCTGLYRAELGTELRTLAPGVFRNDAALTEVGLGSRLTQVGAEAFGGCSSLGSVDLGTALEQLGTRAFRDCMSLTTVTHGNALTALGEEAFMGCTLLRSFRPGSGLKTIGARAFLNCSSLTGTLTLGPAFERFGTSALMGTAITGFEVAAGNPTYSSFRGLLLDDEIRVLVLCPPAFTGELDLPVQLQRIGTGAAMGCTGITGLSLPDGVQFIEDCAFEGCTGLTGPLELPNKIEAIGDRAFYGCENLGPKVTFPETLKSLGFRAFTGCHRLQSVYFNGDAPSAIGVLDPGPTFERLLVTLYYKTDRQGWVSGTYKPGQQYWKGYRIQPWVSRKLPAMQVPEGGYVLRVVTPDGEPIPDAQVTVDNSKMTTKTDQNGVAIIPLTPGMKIHVQKQDFLNWQNDASHWRVDPTGMENVVLMPEKGSTLKLSCAYYSKNQDFSKSNDVLTRTKKITLGRTGTLLKGQTRYLRCRVNLQSQAAEYLFFQGDRLLEKSSNGDFTLHMSNIKKDEPCRVRVIGKDGSQMDTPLNLIFVETPSTEHTTMQLAGNKFTFKISDRVPFLGGMNLHIEMPFDIPIQYYQSADGKIRIGLNAKISENPKTQKQELDELKETMQLVRKLGNSPLTVQNQKRLNKLVKDPKNWSFFQPVTANMVGYLELDPGSTVARGCVMVMISSKVIQYRYHTAVAVPPYVVFVSIPVDFSVGMDTIGEIELDWKTSSLTTGLSMEPYAKLDVVLLVGHEKLLGVGPSGTAELRAKMVLGGKQSGLQTLDLTGQMGIRGYFLNSYAEKVFGYRTWNLYTANGAAVDISLSSSLLDADACHTMDLSYLRNSSPWLGGGASLLAADATCHLDPLVINGFRNAQPVMIAGQQGLYAAYVTADAPAPGETLSPIRLVVTSSDGGAWREPVTVDPAAVLDGSPALLAADGKLYLAYTRTDPNADTATLSGTARGQQIVVGQLDPNTLTFQQQAQFDGTGYAQAPQLILEKGQPTLVWMDTAVTNDQDVLQAPSGAVRYSRLSGGSWSPAETLAQVEQPLLNMTAGAPDGVLTAACWLDTDKNLNTQEDQELWALTANGGRTKLADTTAGLVTYGVFPGTGKEDFLWNQGEELCSASGGRIPVPGLSHQYQTTADRVYYALPRDGAAELAMVVLENGSWSAPVQLTRGGGYLENLNIASWNGQDHVFALQNHPVFHGETMDDPKDLVTGVVVPVSDLSLDEVDCPQEGLAPDASAPATAVITNHGDHPVTQIALTVDGVETLHSCQLKPGESLTLNLPLTYPSGLKEFRLEVREKGREDYTPENNSTTLQLGQGDLAVEAFSEKLGSHRSVVAVVRNQGLEPAGGVLRILGADGNVLVESAVEPLEAGQQAVLRWDPQEVFGDRDADLIIEAQSSGPELRAGNDLTTLYLPGLPQETVRWEGETIQVQSVPADCKTVICAIYSEQDQLLRTEVQKPAGETMSFPAKQGSWAKVFFLTEAYAPAGPACRVTPQT